MKEGKPLRIEIRTTELPASKLWRIASMFGRGVGQSLAQAGLRDDISFGDNPISTPRLIIINMEGVRAEPRSKKSVIRRGPKIDKSLSNVIGCARAVAGFLEREGKKQSDLIEVDHKGEHYWAVVSEVGGFANAVNEAVLAGFRNIKGVRMMKFGGYSFPRPIRSLACFYGEKPVELSVRGLYPHAKLPDNIMSADERAELIVSDVKCAGYGDLYNFDNDELFSEVVDMCERPHGIVVEYPAHYLRLPAPLIHSMFVKHLRAFPAVNLSGDPINRFLFVADKIDDMPMNTVRIREGLQRVAVARLEDANFIYNRDMETAASLQSRRYRASVAGAVALGSVTTSVQRMALCLGEELFGLGEAELKIIQRATTYLHADYGTHMVNDYPELQGWVASHLFRDKLCQHSAAIIARRGGSKLWAGDPECHSNIERAVRLAIGMEKLYRLIEFAGVPTTSKDPYGLKKTMIDVLEMLEEEDLTLTKLMYLVEPKLMTKLSVGTKISLFDFAFATHKNMMREVDERLVRAVEAKTPRGYFGQLDEKKIRDDAYKPSVFARRVSELNQFVYLKD